MTGNLDIPTTWPVLRRRRLPSGSATGVGVGIDEQIYCPICKYNLSGIESGRCPECGAWFHRESLMAVHESEAVTLIPWDEPNRMSPVHQGWATLRICLFNARRFAHAFSVQRQDSRVASFYLLCMTGIALTLGGCLLFAPYLASWVSGLPMAMDAEEVLGVALGIGAACLAHLGMTFGAAFILWLSCPHFDGERHFRPWAQICGFAGAHHLLIAVCLGVAVSTFLLMEAEHAMGVTAAVLIPLWIACGLLTAFTLTGVVRRRCPQDRSYWFVGPLLWANYTIGPVLAAIPLYFLVNTLLSVFF